MVGAARRAGSIIAAEEPTRWANEIQAATALLAATSGADEAEVRTTIQDATIAAALNWQPTQVADAIEQDHPASPPANTPELRQRIDHLLAAIRTNLDPTTPSPNLEDRLT